MKATKAKEKRSTVKIKKYKRELKQSVDEGGELCCDKRTRE